MQPTFGKGLLYFDRFCILGVDLVPRGPNSVLHSLDVVSFGTAVPTLNAVKRPMDFAIQPVFRMSGLAVHVEIGQPAKISIVVLPAHDKSIAHPETFPHLFVAMFQGREIPAAAI